MKRLLVVRNLAVVVSVSSLILAACADQTRDEDPNTVTVTAAATPTF